MSEDPYTYTCEVRVEARYEVEIRASNYDKADELIDLVCQHGVAWQHYLPMSASEPNLTDEAVVGIIECSDEPEDVYDARELEKDAAKAANLLRTLGYTVRVDANPETGPPLVVV